MTGAEIALVVLTIVGWGVTAKLQLDILSKQNIANSRVERYRLDVPRRVKQLDEFVSWMTESYKSLLMFMSAKIARFDDLPGQKAAMDKIIKEARETRRESNYMHRFYYGLSKEFWDKKYGTSLEIKLSEYYKKAQIIYMYEDEKYEKFYKESIKGSNVFEDQLTTEVFGLYKDIFVEAEEIVRKVHGEEESGKSK